MEAAPLTLAHAHARQASHETQKAHLTLAGAEHELAAGEYARASSDAGDPEAVRTLRMLEEHHRKLAQIIKAKDVMIKRASHQKEVHFPADPAVGGTEHAQQASEKPSAPPFLKSSRRKESSPALAKDIASRRGIPQARQKSAQTTASNVSTLQAVGRMSTGHFSKSREQLQGARTSPEPAALQPRKDTAETSGADAGTEDGFARFYSTLTSGPLSKLSSMLAFAGLPLTEESHEEQMPPRPDKTSARVSSGADVNHLFSKAALRAIEEQQRNQGFSGNTFGPGESFYVIPASGGTASYANILSKQETDRQQTGGLGEDINQYVDARELPTRQAPKTGPGRHREEELQIENQALKQILDKLSHRLQAFESHAQDASMAALTQSMISVKGQPGVSNPESEERMRAMEAQLGREMKEREQLGLENQRQKQIITKYRSHWEQLKDSARAKDKAKREQAEPV